LATAGQPPLVRAEGYTELLGDILLSCTGGDPAQPFLTNFQIFLNTNVTSRLLSANVSEALLIIDEAGSNSSRTLAQGGPGVPTPLCVAPATDNSNRAQSSGGAAGGTGPACNPGTATAPAQVTAGNTFQTGTYTVFYGQRIQEGLTTPTGAAFNVRENALVWPGVPVVPPGSNRTRTFRFTNIRANANGVGVSSTFVPSQITAYVSIFPPGTLPIDQPTQTIGFVQQGMAFGTRNASNTDSLSTGVDQCTGQPGSEFRPGGTLSGTGSIAARGLLRFREGFQNAFKPQLAPGQQPSAVPAPSPGQVFHSESGFVRAETGASGRADAGTRLSARFSNVPTNVRLFVSQTELQGVAGTGDISAVGSGATRTPDPARATFVSTDANGSSGFTGGVSAQGTITNTVAGAVQSQALVEVPVVNGTATATWEIQSADPSVNDELFFSFAIGYSNASNTNQVGLGTGTIIGNLAPFYPTGAANLMSSTLPIPRFAAGTTSSTAFEIRPCRSNLLFPYVTNWAGFDTGLAIANTSDDRSPTSAGGSISSNTETGTIQSGRCRLNYYGRLANGNAPTRLQETTDREVAAGETITLVLSSGGGLGLQGNANFQGYIIAQCDFRVAHGFAFITDGPIGQARVAEGYLALVLDGGDASTRRDRVGSTGESRGH
jgi:hypothetical protein